MNLFVENKLSNCIHCLEYICVHKDEFKDVVHGETRCGRIIEMDIEVLALHNGICKQVRDTRNENNQFIFQSSILQHHNICLKCFPDSEFENACENCEDDNAVLLLK